MTFASMPPPKTMPSAREEDAGPAAFAPTTAATAQNAPVATAVRKRAPRMSPKLDESATMTCPIAKTTSAELKVTRRGTLSVKIAIAGVPTIIPIAKTVIIRPTFAIDVPRSPAISGRMPATTNSVVPIKKTPTAST